MNKKGMIFEGLKVRNEIKKALQQEEGLPNCIQEENGYLSAEPGEHAGKNVLKGERELKRVLEKLLEEDGEEICLDVTYFLVFAAAQNPVCREELKRLAPEQIIGYQQMFLDNGYHGDYFLSCLGYEEHYFAAKRGRRKLIISLWAASAKDGAVPDVSFLQKRLWTLNGYRSGPGLTQNSRPWV